MLQPRESRDAFQRRGLGMERDVDLAPFNPACLHEGFLRLDLELGSPCQRLGPGVMATCLRGDPSQDLSWIVPGSVARKASGSLEHGAYSGSEWKLSNGARDAVFKQQLPSPIALANGFARLIREAVHPRYGEAEGPRPYDCDVVASTNYKL